MKYLSTGKKLPGDIKGAIARYIQLTSARSFNAQHIRDFHSQQEATQLKETVILWLKKNIYQYPFSQLLSFVFTPCLPFIHDIDSHDYAHHFVAQVFDTVLSIQTADEFFDMQTPSRYRDGTSYRATDMQKRIQLFAYLEKQHRTTDEFVDWGSGPGPVAFQVGVACTLARITLVENNHVHAQQALLNKKTIQELRTPKNHISIIQKDAARTTISDASIHYFYKPFGWDTMSAVLNTIKKEYISSGKKQTIILNVPAADDELLLLFFDEPWLIYLEDELEPPLYVWQSN